MKLSGAKTYVEMRQVRIGSETVTYFRFVRKTAAISHYSSWSVGWATTKDAFEFFRLRAAG